MSEQVMGGASFVRVDVPSHGDCQAFSKMFGASSIYCITPVSEEAARAAASRLDEQPMTEWELPDEWRSAIRQQRIAFDSQEDFEAGDYPL